MTIAFSTAAATHEVSLFRLYALRALYLLIAVGQGSIQGPLLFQHGNWTLMSGVAHAMLAALAAASVLGVIYPLKMLPLLFFELLWKTVWLAGIALPLWLANRMDADTLETVWECAMGAIVPIVLPWGYIHAQYIRAPADRWR